MKPAFIPCPAPLRAIAFTGALLGFAVALPAPAAVTDISASPLSSSSSSVVKPNILFELDTSGSMAWGHAPDEAQPFAGQVGYANSHCNSIYYDPNIAYVAPKKSDGTDYSNASFTGAWKDGYNTGSGTVNLSTSFYAYDNTTSFGAGTDTAQAAYYYTYSGNAITDFQNTSSQFYTECMLPQGVVAVATITVAGNSNTIVSGVTVGGTTITNGATNRDRTASSMASDLAGNITRNGYSATSSGAVITISASSLTAVGLTPVISVSSGSMTFTPTKFVKVPFTKVTVGSTSGPGNTDERQNFANWFSFYRTRILMMKTGAGRAFSSVSQNYRVGFMTIYATPSSSTTDAQFLSINDFIQTQKDSFYTKLYALSPSGGTPLKQSFTTGARIFTGKLGPDPVQYSCQQNFLILSTDGYWNAGSANGVQVNGSTAVGNQDNNISKTPRPMYDGGLSGSTNTLADAATYYYYTDLRNSSLGNCTGALGSGTDVCQDNVPTTPQDPLSTQHVTLFTLGLGTNGSLQYSTDYLTGGSADYNAIIAGSKDWPTPVGDTLTTIDDLWHAAVNGHGQYFGAKNPDLLVSGLHTALAAAKTREAAGAAASTSNLEPVQGDNFAYVANYRTVKWDGDVQSRTIDLQTGAISTTATWSAQSQIDASVSATSDTRTIYTRVNGSQALFQPSSFTAAQKSAWFTPTASPALSQVSGWTPVQSLAATPDTLINYLRGETGYEERTGNVALLYRTREHVLGDIIDAKPVYVKQSHFLYNDAGYATFNAAQASRQGVVYVGANDGMLHAINASTGAEMWAYIPSFVLPNLKALADDNYSTQHEYYVDGSPTAADIQSGGTWKTILVGGLGDGGKGYYALDVSNPSAPVVLWEFTDTNMGLTYGPPVIGKLQDGTWVAVLSSGYNNADGVGRLYVLDANSGTLKFTISTGVGTSATPSGLAKIVGFTQDPLHDNTILRMYGGDLLGNVWRFDPNDIIPPSGKDAFLLATLKVSGVGQPITASPELGTYTTGGVTYNYVFVGTGRYLGTTDLTDTSQQSLYGLIDKFLPSGIGDVRGAPNCTIVKQTLSVLSTTTRGTSQLPVDPASTCGWELDFNPSNQTPGERVNIDMSLQLGVLAVATNVPMNSVCTVGGTSFIYFLNYLTGTTLASSAGGIAGTQFGNSILVGLNTIELGTGSSSSGCTANCATGRVVTIGTGSDDTRIPVNNPTNTLLNAAGKRVMWRELLN